MKVQLNGEEFILDAPSSVADLLERQDLVLRRVAVEINGEIIPRGEHASRMIGEGDCIEVVHALGGG